jgi:menaquinone-9 beta-reductase
MADVVIIGGGLAGLSAALSLNRCGMPVTVVEKKQYPFHKVCGEYVSNEVLPYLESLGISVGEMFPSRLTRLALTSVTGQKAVTDLDLGGFGLSRYRFDKFLYDHAKSRGIAFLTGTKVNEVKFDNNKFTIQLSDTGNIVADLVISAYGKRSNLDQKLKRPFFLMRSPYLGVKYHIRTDFPIDLIQLDNFEGGYCGICKIEEDKYNLCYLVKNELLKKYGTLENMEREVLFRNMHIRRHFKESDFLSDKPEVINEISFSRKSVTEDHILFCGDAAGMITPLCGNGMAMAIHSGKILADTICSHLKADPFLQDRVVLESNYQNAWRMNFSWRLTTGKFIQDAFLQPGVASAGVKLFKNFPGVLKALVKKTHGNPF